ncbi:MAG: hypothetical protein AB3X44_17065 [Leptothrix sp. (in: b-proteobacteria)]
MTTQLELLQELKALLADYADSLKTVGVGSIASKYTLPQVCDLQFKVEIKIDSLRDVDALNIDLSKQAPQLEADLISFKDAIAQAREGSVGSIDILNHDPIFIERIDRLYTILGPNEFPDDFILSPNKIPGDPNPNPKEGGC